MRAYRRAGSLKKHLRDSILFRSMHSNWKASTKMVSTCPTTGILFSDNIY